MDEREKRVEREAVLGHEEGWTEVINKRKMKQKIREGKLDVATKGKWSSIQGMVSFYFSEFPDSHGARDMLKAFSYYGDVMEVVIPPKKDKMGRRFGFARFCGVVDPRRFAIRLDNIIIGSKKIHVNIPRFQRESVAGNQKNNISHQQRQVRRPRAQSVWRKKEGGNKFEKEAEEAGMAVNARRDETRKFLVPFNPLPPKIVYHRKIDLSEVGFTVEEDRMQKFNHMFVGVVKIPGNTYSVHEWFSANGVFSVKAMPLGANKVLLEEMEEGTIQAMVENDGDWLSEKFDDIRRWSPNEVDNERVVWLRCHGIPVHAWCEDFFASLVRKYGDFLGVDESTRKKTSLDMARISIRTRCYDVFNMVVVANINDSLFNIKMIEEWCGPHQWSSVSKEDGSDAGGAKQATDSVSSAESDDDFEKEPPLSAAAGGGFNESDTEGEDEQSVEGNNDEEFEESCERVNETVEFNEDARRDNHAESNKVEGHVIFPTFHGEDKESNSIGGETKYAQALSLEGEASLSKNMSLHVHGTHNDDSPIKGVFGGVFEVGGTSNVGGCMKKNSSLKIKKRKRVRSKKKRKEMVVVTSSLSEENSSSQNRLGAVRNSSLSGSFLAGNPSGSVPGNLDNSVGDSGIMMGNDRFKKVHEDKIAGKLWKIATEELGVTGEEVEEVYIERIKAMEVRDKGTLGRKETKPRSSQ